MLRGMLTLETWRLKWRYLWRPWEEASEKAARATVRAMVVLEKKCMVAGRKNQESQVGDIDRSRACRNNQTRDFDEINSSEWLLSKNVAHFSERG